jgi:predicted nucleic-acid-binding protein
MQPSQQKFAVGMRAVDTNVIVRYLTRDHAGQYGRARALIDSEPVFAAMTVILETEWVLRSGYGYSSAAISKAMRDFAGLPTVTVEEPSRLKNALALLDSGIDLADAFHLVAADGCDAFMSFDRELAKRAADIAKLPVREP